MYPQLQTTATPSTRERGLAAEDTAAEFLRRQKYRILARNLFTPYGEIDILAKQGSEYVCVEVRSRHKVSHDALAPEDVLTRSKYTHLVRSLLSLAFLQNKLVRIDLITVEAGKVRKHYQDIEV